MNWTAEKLEQAIAKADPQHDGPNRILRGHDSHGLEVSVWTQPFNCGFNVQRKGVIHSMGERDAVAYLTAFGFVPDGEAAK